MKSNHFIILVTVHNSIDWIGKCLDSVISQDYKNYRLVIIDDHSTDGTWDVVCKYEGCLVRNDVRVFHSLINMILGIKAFSNNPEDIIISIDGDDWLADNSVLSYLNEVYQEDVWLTYGQFIPRSGTYNNFCQPIDAPKYRKSGVWATSHLKTFKKKAWDRIKDEDFLDYDGKYPITCGDVIFMYPIIEMAGNKRIRFINKILYIYNDLNPMNHCKTIPQDSLRIAKYFQSKPCYDIVD
jgi:glycosyltransferase involved in cell wall biosynthesis